MQITIYSFLTTVFWSSILIMLLFAVRKILRIYDAFNIHNTIDSLSVLIVNVYLLKFFYRYLNQEKTSIHKSICQKLI